jgi:molybdenum cofactor biosynthesis enzyme MoaA
MATEMELALRGNVDSFSLDAIEGWAFDEAAPERAVQVGLFEGDRQLLTVAAAELRADLNAAGIGDGRHAFRAPLPESVFDGRSHRIHIRFVDTGDEIANSPCEIPPITSLVHDFKLDPHNMDTVLAGGRVAAFKFLAVDVNDTCNAACRYCPNVRSPRRLALEDFERFLAGQVQAVGTFQFGCGQEPTLEPALVEFFRTLRRSATRPSIIRLITNGVLLDCHDASAMGDCGLSTLVLSLDSARPATNDWLRPGAPLDLVVENLRAFRRSCPDVGVELSITVTSRNIGELLDLVDFGQRLGVGAFVFREITDHSGGVARQRDFAEVFTQLALRDGEFEEMQRRIVAARGSASCQFAPRARIQEWTRSAAAGQAEIAGE